MILVNEEKLQKRTHGANPVCAYATVVFTHIIISDLSEITGNKNSDAVIVTLTTGKGKNAVRFSLTGNAPYFNKNRQRVKLDDDSEEGLVFYDGMGTAQDCLDAWEKVYGNFTKWDAVKVHFGAPVHFVDDEGNILKTILRVDKMEEIAKPSATDDNNA